MWIPGKPMDGPAYGVAFKGGGGGSSPQYIQSTSTSTTTPWSEQQPYLKTLFSEADRLRQQGGPQYYPGQTLADVPWQTQSAIDLASQRALNGNPLDSQAQGVASDTLSGKYMSPDSNPYLQSAFDSVRAQVQPQIQSQFAGAGRSGSGLANRALGEGLGSAFHRAAEPLLLR